jgi:hypothetical protein
MMLQPGEEIQSLQAVNAQRLEEVFIGREFFARDFKVRCGESEYFVESLVVCSHNLWQIWLRFGALYKFSQTRFNRRLRKQFTE